MIIANESTYSVKEDLKKCGFNWNSSEKRFEAENFNSEKWQNDFCRAAYNGPKQAKQCQLITFTEV